MPIFTHLDTFHSETGNLTVFEKLMPGGIKRVFYIYGAHETSRRGGHRHHKTWNALICIHGSCDVYVNDGETEKTFKLQQPDECLILAPADWHIMESFSSDCILLVLANEYYNPEDYIVNPYLEKQPIVA